MKKLGVIYSRKLEDQKHKGKPFFYNSWQDAFLTEYKQEALEKANRPENSFGYETSNRVGQTSISHLTWCPIFDSSHPTLGEIFFSSLLNRHGSWLDDHFYFGQLPLKERPYHCVWGNGDEFNEKEIQKIRKAHDSCTEKVVLNESD